MSSLLTFDAAIVFINETFGLSVPTLPFSAPWMAPFTALWELLVPGPLPPSSQPLPWSIAASGSWPVSAGGVTLELQNVTINVGGEERSTAGRGRLRRIVDAVLGGKAPKKKRQKGRPRMKGCRDPAA